MTISDHSLALCVSNLYKKYGDVIAVNDISFNVKHGEIVGLLGPNGAGKTTTINMVLGVLEPTSGNIQIDGIDSARHRSQALLRTNFAAVYAPLPGNLTVVQNLRIFAMLYEVKHITQRIEELLVQFDLTRFRHTRCGALSSGEQTRVCVAKAMLNRPRLLLLDEPTGSLDPSKAQEIRAILRESVTGEQCGVLWTSHNMLEVEEMCDRVLFLFKGKILLEGNPKTLPKKHGKETLEALFIAAARTELPFMSGVSA